MSVSAATIPLTYSTGSDVVIRRPISPRRGLQLALGSLWLLDAALQYQPHMFTRSFVTQTIEPAAAGNPGFITGVLGWSSHLMVQHIALYNGIFATVQLLIALGIFYRRTIRLALAASIGWSLMVWLFGEGLGGIFSGASPLMGLPGGVVLYAFVSILVWPSRESQPGAAGSPATWGPLGVVPARVLWVALWGSFSYFLLLSVNRSPSAIGQAITGMAGDEPAWVRSIVTNLGSVAAHHGTELSIGLAVLCGFIAVGILERRLLRVSLVGAAAFGVTCWVAQAFGGIFTGQGTDPNSGILLVLLAACFWPFASVEGRRASW